MSQQGEIVLPTEPAQGSNRRATANVVIALGTLPLAFVILALFSGCTTPIAAVDGETVSTGKGVVT